MQTTTDHLNLAPPAQGRWLGPMGLALVVHGLLVAALTWGVNWQHEAEPVRFEAEIWSKQPAQAAPRAAEPPPPPPPEPAPAPQPAPAPAPPPKPAPAPPPPPPAPRQADVATEQAKKKAEADRLKAQEIAATKLAAEKAAAQKKAVAEKATAEKRAAAEKVAADKTAAEKKAQAEKAQAAKAAAEQQRQLAEEEREAELAKQQRDEQMRRIMGQAGATGGAQSTGTAKQSSGPSPGYAGRVAARIKPNVVFTDAAPGNPRAEIEVRTLPDGTITSSKLVKSSGNAAWDEAVLRAIDRTASLPRDTDGRVPPALIIGLRPQD